MNMDWPTAFVLVAMILAVFGYLAYTARLRAEVMKEGLRKGMTEIEIK